MTGFDAHLTLGGSKKAKDTEYYTTRDIIIDNRNLQITTPIKTLDGTGINSISAESILKDEKNPIFEAGKFISLYRSWRSLHDLLIEGGPEKINGLNQFMNVRTNLWNGDNLTTASLSFSRNPLSDNVFKRRNRDKGQETTITLPALEEDIYDSLLDYVHSASTALVMAPDVRFSKNNAMDTKQYLEFSDHNMSVLSDFNHRPIFAPIQIDIPIVKMQEILHHYKERGYSNIWVNVSAGQIDGTYFARVRSFLRNVNNIFGLENVAIYYTHIRKEIDSNIKDDFVLGSDILSQFFAADFVGIDQKPFRGIPDENAIIKFEKSIHEAVERGEYKDRSDYDLTKKMHENRIFDPETYYYYRPDRYPNDKTLPMPSSSFTGNPSISRFLNSVILSGEMQQSKMYLEENGNIGKYLKGKNGLIENKNILNGIVSGSRQTGLFDILGKL